MPIKFTSDDIKERLTQGNGTKKADWKRVSKKKNADGHWVREFVNKKTGATGTTIENPGVSLTVEITDDPANPGISGHANQNFAPDNSEAAARKIIDIMLNGDENGDFFVDDETLIATAGPALARHFCFAVIHDEDGMLEEMDMEGEFYAIISPHKYFQDSGACYDQPSPISGLLPAGEDVNDCGTWIFEELGTSAEEIYTELKSRGFTWDKSFQDFIDASLTDQLAKHDTPGKPAAAKRPGPAQ